jgi:hypothetical protein
MSRILDKVCRYIFRYAGLTYLIYCAGTGMPGYLAYGLVVRHIRSRMWPTVISGTYKSEEVSHPYNQGRKHPSMEAEYDDRVHSGGLPTLTVHKYKLTSGR